MGRRERERADDRMAAVADVFSRLAVPRTENEIEEQFYQGSRRVSASVINLAILKERQAADAQLASQIGDAAEAIHLPIVQIADSPVAISSTTAYTTVASVFSQTGYASLIEGFFTEGDSASALENVQFRLRVGQVPAADLQNIRGKRGTRESPQKLHLLVQDRTPVVLEALLLTSGLTVYVRGGIVGFQFLPVTTELSKAWAG